MASKVEFDVIARDKASGPLEKVGKSAEKSGGMLEKMGGAAGKMGGGIAGMIPQVAALSLGVAGFGEALSATIGSAMGLEAGVDKLQGKLGLTGETAKMAGNVASKVYAQAWGESIEDVNNTVASVGTNLVDLNKVGSKELTGMVTNAQALADTFDIDVNDATRAAGQLMRTGLAKDAGGAFDLITRGFQTGADRSGDFLDTLNEYSPQFQKLGISGPYAVNLIGAAMKAGARDSDVAADAIKEFSIRAIDGSKLTASGFKMAGLNAKDMAARIAEGGPTAEKAFQTTLKAIMSIDDPVKQNAAGVALMGTQWEDLGPQVMGAMAQATPSVDGFRGSAEKLGETVGDNLGSKVESMKRRMAGWLTQIGGIALPLLEQLATWVETKVMPALEEWVTWLSGPGKYVVAETFLGWVENALNMATMTIDALNWLARHFVNWTGGFLKTAAEAFGWMPEIGPKLRTASANFDKFGDQVLDTLNKASGQTKKWSGDVDKMKKEVRLRGNIADLDAKLKSAKDKLKDPNLTRERKAKLTADISKLVASRREAQRQLDSLRGRTVTITTNRVTNYVERHPPSLPWYGAGFAASGGRGFAGMSAGAGQVRSITATPNRLDLGQYKGGGGGNIHFHLNNQGVIGSRAELQNWLVRALDDLRRQGRLPAGATIGMA